MKVRQIICLIKLVINIISSTLSSLFSPDAMRATATIDGLRLDELYGEWGALSCAQYKLIEELLLNG